MTHPFTKSAGFAVFPLIFETRSGSKRYIYRETGNLFPISGALEDSGGFQG